MNAVDSAKIKILIPMRGNETSKRGNSRTKTEILIPMRGNEAVFIDGEKWVLG